MAEPQVQDEVMLAQRYVMEALPVSVQRRVSLPPFVGATVTWDARRDYLDREREAMVVDLRAYVLAQHLADDEYVGARLVPATWWDMRREYRRSRLSDPALPPWRRRLLSLLWRRDLRRPVETRRVEVRVRVDRYLAYAEAQVPIPDHLGSGRPIEIVTLDRVGDL